MLAILLAMLMIVGALIFFVGLAATITSTWLIVKYFRFNRRENSLGLTGMQIARKILDDNGLEHIKVKRTGSLLFGNSYSHYFKKVRLRGLIRHETSLTSMGMGAQKAALAILDKEGDEEESEGTGNGQARPWIIPLSSSAEGTDGGNRVDIKPDLPPCPPSEMEKILRKNINGIINDYLASLRPGMKQTYSRMLYRRMRLVVAKPVSEMTGKELEKVWIWLRREYGGFKK